MTVRQALFGALLLSIPALSCQERRADNSKTADPPAVPNTATAPAAPHAAPSTFSNMVAVAAPGVAHQLVSGFYPVEDNAWRWTGKRFVVKLGAPSNTKSADATLRFKFTIPDVASKKYGKLGISCSAGAAQIPAQFFDRVGQHEFVATLPASALLESVVEITFTLDKSLPPTGSDQRELGVIAQQFSLEAK